MASGREKPHTELMVALDYAQTEPALKLVAALKTFPVIYKVGLELFVQAGPDFVRELKRLGHRVFLDLKMHDIPNTVASAATQAASLDIDYLTVHLAGGRKMFQAIQQSFLDGKLIKKPRILGVSVLTSFDRGGWAEVIQALQPQSADPPPAPDQSVQALAGKAVAWDVGGLVCSAHELVPIRQQYQTLYTVVPGIRLEGGAANDQARVMTPHQATQAGANAIVVGRPITQAESPAEVVKQILREISI